MYIRYCGAFLNILLFIVIVQEGAFACVFKSVFFPGEAVATRRGSPLLIGIRSKSPFSTDKLPIIYTGQWIYFPFNYWPCPAIWLVNYAPDEYFLCIIYIFVSQRIFDYYFAHYFLNSTITIIFNIIEHLMSEITPKQLNLYFQSWCMA